MSITTISDAELDEVNGGSYRITFRQLVIAQNVTGGAGTGGAGGPGGAGGAGGKLFFSYGSANGGSGGAGGQGGQGNGGPAVQYGDNAYVQNA